MADDFERGGSKLYAALARAFADDPVVADIVGDHRPRWEAPPRLFGGVHYLELSGVVQHPWLKFRGVLESQRDWLKRFVAEQPVQTNEVQRSWALLPAFLTVADGRPLDIIELGPSAGLNLFWDRYRYPVRRDGWGSADARSSCRATRNRRRLRRSSTPTWRCASASASTAVPWTLRPTTGRACCRRSCGPTRPRGSSACGVRSRSRGAIRRELLEGDYVEVLPPLLAARDLSVLTRRLPLGLGRLLRGRARAART